MKTTRKSARRRRPHPAEAYVPTTMHAAAIDRVGPASVLKMHELPIPKLGPRDVLIEVDTAGVGSWEPSQRAGEWGVEGANFPLVLGSDGSGTVVARGSQARRFRVGDRVYAFNFGGDGPGFDAEYAVVPASRVARIPRGLDMLHAGASPAVALTALQGIDDALHVKRNENVVVVGASGNVGIFAVQFAKQRGARVFAIASGRDGVALARRLGADFAVDGKNGDVSAALRRCAPDGVDAVLGLAGGDAFEAAIDALKPKGRVAFPNGVEPAPRKRRGVKFVTYDAQAGIQEFNRLNRALAKQPLVVPIAKEFRLDQAAQAHRRVEQGHTLGRVVIRPSARARK